MEQIRGGSAENNLLLASIFAAFDELVPFPCSASVQSSWVAFESAERPPLIEDFGAKALESRPIGADEYYEFDQYRTYTHLFFLTRSEKAVRRQQRHTSSATE